MTLIQPTFLVDVYKHRAKGLTGNNRTDKFRRGMIDLCVKMLTTNYICLYNHSEVVSADIGTKYRVKKCLLMVSDIKAFARTTIIMSKLFQLDKRYNFVNFELAKWTPRSLLQSAAHQMRQWQSVSTKLPA